MSFGSGRDVRTLLRFVGMTNTSTRPVGSTSRNAGRRIALGAALLGLGGGLVGWLAPDQTAVGATGPLLVLGGASAAAYRSTVDAVAGAPGPLDALAEPGSEAGLLVLGLLLALRWWRGRARRAADAVAGVLLTGLGTVLAYGASEALKLVVDEERPCRALTGIPAVSECPPPGDWSFPSNHATLAAALATGLALLRPRWALLVLPIGGATAALRVAAGVHYPHDVLAGAVLGATVTAAVVIALLPFATDAVRAAGGLRPVRPLLVAGQPRLVGEHRRGRPVGHPEAGQDRADVGLHRSLHHPHPAGDLTVGQPSGEQHQHLALPGGERGHLVPGGGPAQGGPTGPGRGEVCDHPGGHLG